MKTISLTIPIEEGPLRRAAIMLNGLAEDCTTVGIVGPFKGTVVTHPTPGVTRTDTLTTEEIAEGDAELAADEVETPVLTADTVTDIDPVVIFGESDTTTTEPAGTAAPTVELDGEGIPWDIRIHTDAKTKIKAGTWKLKRSIDTALVEQVKAELLANMSVAAPIVTEEPVLTTEATVTTFPELVTYVTAKCNEGVVQQQHIEKLVAKHGITGGLPAVANRPDLIPAIYADMVALWPTTQG